MNTVLLLILFDVNFQQKLLEEEARRHVLAKLEQGVLKRPTRTDKYGSSASSETTISTVHVERERPQRPEKPLKPVNEKEDRSDSVKKKHHYKHCHKKHKHHKKKSSCHCHHNHHHRAKARRREELLKEIKEGKLELPKKKKPLARTFSL